MLTIAVPTLNSEKRITYLLDSISAQSRGDFEVFISDNASTDNTNNVCSNYASNDGRITVYRQPSRLSMRMHHRFLLEKVSSKFIAWPGDDDILEKDWVQETMGVLENRADLNMVSTGIRYKKPTKELIISNQIELNDDVCARMRQLSSDSRNNNVWLTWYGIWRTSYLREVFMRLTDIYQHENLLCTDNLLQFHTVLDQNYHFIRNPLFIKRLLSEQRTYRTEISYGERYRESQEITRQGLEYMQDVIQSARLSKEEEELLIQIANTLASTAFGSTNRWQLLKWRLLPWYRRKPKQCALDFDRQQSGDNSDR